MYLVAEKEDLIYYIFSEFWGCHVVDRTLVPTIIPTSVTLSIKSVDLSPGQQITWAIRILCSSKFKPTKLLNSLLISWYVGHTKEF